MSDGTISVLAGCGAPRQADGHGTSAAFHAPNGIAVDAEGTLFVADSGNHCIRRVTPDGTVTTSAGTGCPALTATGLNSPCGVSICNLPDRGAVLLIADRSNSCVRVMQIDGVAPPSVVPPSTMRDDLACLLDGEYDSDEGGSGSNGLSGEAIFDVQGRILRAPKAVLSARCAHFRAMFASGMRESRAGEPVYVTDVQYSVYRALLDYLLCDELPLQMETSVTLDLMMLANAYGVTRLESLCARRLVNKLDQKNVGEVARCANLIGSMHLKRAADSFGARMDLLGEEQAQQQQQQQANAGEDVGKTPTTAEAMR